MFSLKNAVPLPLAKFAEFRFSESAAEDLGAFNEILK